MKKIVLNNKSTINFYIVLSAAALMLTFASCSNDERNQFVYPTGVTLDRTVDSLVLGDSVVVTAIVEPYETTIKNVKWKSNNPVVASVSDGAAAMLTVGTATITAATDNNKTATYTVVVGFGEVSFASAQTWKVGNQEWSDAVQAQGCKKEFFNGGASKGYCADCRSNPGEKGDLFSWTAVVQHQDLLCPDGWRVPTRQDFVDLDVALGGNGKNRYYGSNTSFILESYANASRWGGSFGGYAGSVGGALAQQGSGGYYWSKSENSATDGYMFTFDKSGYALPQATEYKNLGLKLRCVRAR